MSASPLDSGRGARDDGSAQHGRGGLTTFETAELGRKLSKKDYEAREPGLRTELLEAQAELKDARCSVLILIGGVDGAGKGETVNLLHEWMDPHYLEARAFGPPSDEEAERPEFWRFWRALPPKGRIGLLFGSWYTRPIIDRVFARSDDAALERDLVRIKAFEKLLTDDGTLLVKLWFHLSKKAQKKRLRELESHPSSRWRVTKTDWRHFRHYDDFRLVSERVLRATSTGEAPWVVVEGADRRFRSLFVGEHILSRLKERLARTPLRPTTSQPARATAASKQRSPSIPDSQTLLNTLDLSKRLGDERYERDLEKYQGRLNRLCRKAKARGRSAILVFEGWDAAGKGGIIRRLTAGIDARDYQVIPISAPTDEERAHHYLWRFWRHLPRAGRVTIFDRSWYGRVLVERVEGFASEDEWRRGYPEIVDFERQLHDHGILLHKFWIHLDRHEQLRRFEERQKTAFKHYKITEEDFRNRAKWDDYEVAANEMLERTSTEIAPWTLVEGNDKQYARIKVLKTVCRRLEETL